MNNTNIEKLRNARLLRKAQLNSQILVEIKLLQHKIVEHSFANSFDKEKHQQMMKKLKKLRSDYSQIAL